MNLNLFRKCFKSFAFLRIMFSILFFHCSIFPSVHLFICPFVHLSVCSSVHLSVCPSVHLSICSSVHLSITLYVTAGYDLVSSWSEDTEKNGGATIYWNTGVLYFYFLVKYPFDILQNK